MRTPRRFTFVQRLARTGAAVAAALGLTGSAAAQLGQASIQPAEPSPALEELRYARNLSNAFKAAVERVEPAVVHITSQRLVQRVRRDIFGRTVRTGESRLLDSGLGSGVIVDERGIILTNHHVIAEADALIVRLGDEREFEAELVGSDPATDVAVLRIDAPDLVAAPLGDSDGVDVGEWVLAIGSPFGFDRTVTAGIVSAKGRSNIGDDEGDRYQDFLQTDASINPGNSGGPLITLDGAVIGINTAIASRGGGSVGIGFAIPANMARSVADLLLDQGRVERGWLGVGLFDLDPQTAAEMDLPPRAAGGVLVRSVQAASPAARAGLEVGDVVMEWNGTPTPTSNRLRNLIALTRPGDTALMRIIRGTEDLNLRPTLIDRDDARAELLRGRNIDALGVIVRDLNRQTARELGLRRVVPGAVVLMVDPGGPADRAGLEVGDVITEVNRRDTRTADELVRTIDRAGDRARIGLIRGRVTGTVEIDLR